MLPDGEARTQRRSSIREVSQTALVRIRRFIVTAKLALIRNLGRSESEVLALAYTTSRL